VSISWLALGESVKRKNDGNAPSRLQGDFILDVQILLPNTIGTLLKPIGHEGVRRYLGPVCCVGC
jgi:hypothetical protein